MQRNGDTDDMSLSESERSRLSSRRSQRCRAVPCGSREIDGEIDDRNRRVARRGSTRQQETGNYADEQGQDRAPIAEA